MFRNLMLGTLCAALTACATGGYTRMEVIYAEPAEYVYVVPVERVVVVTREVLVARGWVVYRVESSGGGRIIWARRGDGEIIRVFATPQGGRVVVRTVAEVRERGGRGKHRGWVRRAPPREIIADVDVRLRAH